MWFFSVKSSAVSLMTLLSLQVCIAQISAVGTIFFDMETECFAPLLEADIDGNLKLNRMEYVKFIQLESQNELFQGGSLVHLPDQFSLQFKRLICFFGDDGEEFDGEDCLRWRRWGTHTRWKPSNQESYLWYPQPPTCLILRKNRAALSCCSGLLLLWWFVVMRGAFDSASVFVFLAGVISKTIVHVDSMISCD